jgi:REP element-mobilizing transposase RayT
MGRSRLTYQGSYHHVISRGIKGEDIFFDDRAKSYFLKALKGKSTNNRIRIFAYCIMDNHYHLILQNSSDKLSDLMRQLNGQYGIYYRKRTGGRGYVFQDRFKSTLIQEDRYLEMVIIYVLLNPVRGGVTEDPWDYKWSSIYDYFNDEDDSFIDNKFVEGLFRKKSVLDNLLVQWSGKDLPIKKTRVGDVLGEDKFIEKAMEKFDRRKKKGESRRMRRFEYELDPVKRVIEDFEKEKGVKIEGINIKSNEGKSLRNELLVLLKDRSGLTYSEVIQYLPFQKLKYSSLGQLYKRTKEQQEED